MFTCECFRCLHLGNRSSESSREPSSLPIALSLPRDVDRLRDRLLRRLENVGVALRSARSFALHHVRLSTGIAVLARPEWAQRGSQVSA